MWLLQAEQRETHTDTDTLFFCSICFRDALFALQPFYFFIQSCCVSLSTLKKRKKENKLTTLSRTRMLKVCSSIQTFKGTFSAECQRIVFLNLPLRVKNQCMACSCKTNSDATPGCPSLPPHLYKARRLGRCAASS